MAATTTRATGPLSAQLLETIGVWSRSQRRSLRSLTEFRLRRNVDSNSAVFTDSAEWYWPGHRPRGPWMLITNGCVR